VARPKTNHEGKKQQIVEAALQTFARHGYEGTTNKLIAHEAGGISPGLIYHYFPEGKTQLFQAVLQQFPPLQTLAGVVQKSQELPPAQFLQNVAGTYAELLQQESVMNLVRIMMVEAPHQPELAQVLLAQVVPTLVLPLVAYIQKQTALGNFKSLPPMAGPLLLFGPLLGRAMITGVIGDKPAPIPIVSAEDMLKIVVQTFLYGVWQPQPEAEK